MGRGSEVEEEAGRSEGWEGKGENETILSVMVPWLQYVESQAVCIGLQEHSATCLKPNQEGSQRNWERWKGWDAKISPPSSASPSLSVQWSRVEYSGLLELS